jgi:orotate phosphoribosyltransferase
MDLLKQCQAHVVGVVVALDREETTSVASAESTEKPLSAVQVSNRPRPVLHLIRAQQVEQQFQISVVAVIR